MEWTDGEYRISDDKSLLSVDRTYGLLSLSLFGSTRTKENVRMSIEHSICYGVFHGPRQENRLRSRRYRRRHSILAVRRLYRGGPQEEAPRRKAHRMCAQNAGIKGAPWDPCHE